MDDLASKQLIASLLLLGFGLGGLYCSGWLIPKILGRHERAGGSLADASAEVPSRLPAAECLRTPATAHQPDPRMAPDQAVWTEAFARHHASVAGLILDATVPDRIQIAFETARNLYLYAWHVYRFYPVAEMQALVTLEAGLRAWAREHASSPPKNQPGLRSLLKQAIAKGKLRNEGFRRWRENTEQRARQRRDLERVMFAIEHGITELAFDEGEPIEIQPEDQAWDLVGLLKTNLPDRRNAYAHGDAGLTDQGLSTLKLVADILNQLFADMAGVLPSDQSATPHVF